MWLLPSWELLGGAIPTEWAVAAALRDFAPAAEVSEIWLYNRERQGTRLLPTGEEKELSGEYAGPLPVYRTYLNQAGIHLYVDALTAEIKARRTSGDSLKRVILLVVALLWFFTGITGFGIWIRVFISKQRAKNLSS